MSNHLNRSIFSQSRLAEFASCEELERATGHPADDWPLAVLKELADNSLDACEGAGIAPEIEIILDETGIEVIDNGPGLAPETVERILNFSIRTSSNAAYVAPTRGQQGNALQTLIAMPFAATGEAATSVIISRGVRHEITFDVDPISRVPAIAPTMEPDSFEGTSVFIPLSWASAGYAEMLARVARYGWLNPHLDLTLTILADNGLLESWMWPATARDWRKWLPSDATPAHWYSTDAFKSLMAAEIDAARRAGRTARSVAEFVGDFRNLSSTTKRRDIAEALDIGRTSIDAFFSRSDFDDFDALLGQMQYRSKPVKPRDLGMIGEEHLRAQFNGAPESFQYRKVEVEVEGIPYLAEVAFAFDPDAEERTLVVGLNWSVSVAANPFQSLGFYSLDGLLADLRGGPDEPVEFFLHLASPGLSFLDRGKNTVALPDEVGYAIEDAIKDVTKRWTKQRKAEERDANALRRRLDRLTHADDDKATLRDVAFSFMTAAYMEASDNDTLPAQARQIMYAARPKILEVTGDDVLSDSYFTQTLLPDYVNEHQDECAKWNVVWSDRGHFAEPHTDARIGLGTLAVRGYVAEYAEPALREAAIEPAHVETHGPAGRYGGLFYIEKEGFDDLVEATQLAERHDLSFMSCKGMSVTAARELVDETCARYKIPLFILHDFDISGFSIAATLHRSNRRYTYKNQSGVDFDVIDLGLRLEDIEWFADRGVTLAAEAVSLGNKSPDKLGETLRRNGATEAEIEFLLGGDEYGPRRVELNALVSSRRFIDFVERKLAEHGVRKVIPAAAALADAFRLFVRGRTIERAFAAAVAGLEHGTIDVPADLDERVRAYLAEHPEVSWDDAVQAIVEDDDAG